MWMLPRFICGEEEEEDVQTQMMAVIGENNNFHRTIMVIVIVAVSSAPYSPQVCNCRLFSLGRRREIVGNRRSFVQYIMVPCPNTIFTYPVYKQTNNNDFIGDILPPFVCVLSCPYSCRMVAWHPVLRIHTII